MRCSRCFAFAALAACAVGALAAEAPLAVANTQAMTSGINQVTAMAKDANYVYSLTDTTIIKASAADITDFGVDDLAVHTEGPWDSLTTVAVDDAALYVTAKYQGDDADDNGVSLKGRYQVIKFDKSTMQVKATLLIPEADNIPYAMRQVGAHIFLGMYSFPGRVVRIQKSVQNSDLMQIVDSLVFDVGSDDVRSLEFDATDANFLYANCNTMPGRVVRVDISGTAMHVQRTATLPDGIGHILAGTGTTQLLSSVGAGDNMIYVATNQVPARVVKIATYNMQVMSTITLEAGENNAASMVEDEEFLYVGLWTIPAMVVRVSKKKLVREDVVVLDSGLDRASALVTEAVGSSLFIYVGTFSTPAVVAKLSGAILPRNCTLGPWSEWGTCSSTCGRGQETRQRSIVDKARYGGISCAALGGLTESRTCMNDRCPIPCHDGLVHTKTPYVEALTCDNKDSHNKALSTTPACQCPPNKPYLHSLGQYANGDSRGTMCVPEARCNAYVTCPEGSTSCQYQTLAGGGGRIRVLHGKCEGDVNDGKCSQHASTSLGALGYQYHCRHTEGRLGGCQCLCYQPVEEHCDAPPAITYGTSTVSGTGGYHIGSEATYSCNTGYRLTGGSTSRVCLSNHQWSGFLAECTPIAEH